MSWTWNRKPLAILLVGLAVLAGCGGPYDSSVTGIVTLDSQPLTLGTVAFFPSAGGPPAYGQVQSDGSYEVRTGREDGLKSGEYQITVVANERPTVAQSPNGGPPPPGKPITPIWYRTVDSSGLNFTVAPGSNDIPLDLTSQPPAGWQPRGGRRR